jgi:hypothetical protein
VREVGAGFASWEEVGASCSPVQRFTGGPPGGPVGGGGGGGGGGMAGAGC